MTAAYFDVDGTLVSTNLLQPTAYFLANQATVVRGFSRLAGAILQGPIMAIAETRDRRLFNEMLYSHYKGLSDDRLNVLAEEIFEEVILPRMYVGARQLVTKCKEAGQRVVLVTGSLDITTKYLAEHLNADHVIANRLEMKGGHATGKLLRPVVAGPQKAGLMVEDARQHSHDLSECHAYSDSYSDVPMLSVVGHPACVNPDKKLRQLARAYDWPILEIDRPARGSNTRTTA